MCREMGKCQEETGRRTQLGWEKINQQEMAATLTEGFLDIGAGPRIL